MEHFLFARQHPVRRERGEEGKKTDLHSTPHPEHAIIRDLWRQPLQRLLNNIILFGDQVVGAVTSPSLC